MLQQILVIKTYINSIKKQCCLNFAVSVNFIALIFLFSSPVIAEVDLLSEKSRLQISGFLKNETAYRFREPRSYTKIRNTLYVQSRYELHRRIEFNFSGRGYYDAVYDLFDYDTITARSSRDVDQPLIFIEGLAQEEDSNIVEMRELYFDVLGDWADLRIGKQFIIWGVLTGVRVVDELNPMNFKELITPDLLDYRTPLWSVKLDLYHKYGSLEFVWIPELEFNKPAPRGSEWELLQTVPGTVFPRSFNVRDPSRETLKNTEFGFKATTTIWGNELTASYFYTWDDFPVLYRTLLLDQKPTSPDGNIIGGTTPVPVDDQGQPDVETSDGNILAPEFFPVYRRMHMLGGTFQRAIRGQIIKAEAALVKGKRFGVTVIDRDNDGYLDHQGVLERYHIRWGFGVDFNVYKTEIAPSMMQWIIYHYDRAIIQDKFDSSFNLFIRKNFAKRSSTFEMLAIYLVNLGELYVKPKVKFRPSSQFEITIGMDLFYGDKSRLGRVSINGSPSEMIDVVQSSQFIGNFDNNDRVFVEFKYSF